ncbi:uncharacterized protein BDV17DRAFT_256154 [Aspergillus undulatus]|uniref:uncharacterized protein n=1 Tax=Aspergillus undulatus TaxID=1810928 RepID=UPI003CCCC5ED
MMPRVCPTKHGLDPTRISRSCLRLGSWVERPVLISFGGILLWLITPRLSLGWGWRVATLEPSSLTLMRHLRG